MPAILLIGTTPSRFSLSSQNIGARETSRAELGLEKNSLGDPLVLRDAEQLAVVPANLFPRYGPRCMPHKRPEERSGRLECVSASALCPTGRDGDRPQYESDQTKSGTIKKILPYAQMPRASRSRFP